MAQGHRYISATKGASTAFLTDSAGCLQFNSPSPASSPTGWASCCPSNTQCTPDTMDGGQEQCGEKSDTADKNLTDCLPPGATIWTGQVKTDGHYLVSLNDLNDLQPHAEKVLWTVSMGVFNLICIIRCTRWVFTVWGSFIFLWVLCKVRIISPKSLE